MNKNFNKNIVIDYVTPAEACRAIGISEKSTPQITRWINEGRIKGVLNFGNNKAIPISWVKSECLTRDIQFESIKLEDGQVAVSLNDYEPVNQIEKKYKTSHLAVKIMRGQINKDHVIQFGKNWGIEKSFVKNMFK